MIDPKSGEKVGKLNAREVFDEIADAAWRTGDPGLIFIDKINESKANPVPPLGPIESTNPCGEQPLYPFDACNLGSIFLGYFVKDKKIEWDELEKVVKMAVRFWIMSLRLILILWNRLGKWSLIHAELAWELVVGPICLLNLVFLTILRRVCVWQRR